MAVIFFLKNIFLFFFCHPSRSFEAIHAKHRKRDGTYMIPYNQFLQVQKKARFLSFISIFFISVSIIVLAFYSPTPHQKFSQAATISSAVEYTSNTTTNDNVVIASGGTVTLTGGITWTINGTLTVQSGGTIVFQETGGTYTTYPTLSVSGAVTVDSGGTIHSNSKGFTGGATSANGTGTGAGVFSSDTGGGGGHGGTGGRGFDAGAAGGTSYGSTLAPTTAGSGGGGGQSTAGGAGGGVIRLNIGGTLTINGTVTADGANVAAGGWTGGGGAGGSIYVTAESVDGSGSITAKGGNGGNSPGGAKSGGGGSGGRIAVYFNTPGASISTLKGASSVLGGVSGTTYNSYFGFIGEVGTLFFLDVDNKDIDIYNGPDFFQEGDTVTLSGTQATFTGNPKFGDSDATTNDNDAVFDNANSTTQFDDITIAANAYVESKIASGNTIFDLSINYTGIFAITSPTSTDGSCMAFGQATSQDASFDTCFIFEKLTLTGPTATINANAQIFGDGYGNTGGSVNTNGNGTGGGVNSSDTGGGGGHAGAGGRGYNVGATGGVTYDSSTAPVLAGSGGAGGQSTAGGNGGGVIRLNISGTLTINGIVTADGTNSDSGSWTGGGGAGGSIYITSSTLAGAGSLTAVGGNGGNSPSGGKTGGGGGGGFIAYYYAVITYSGSATVTAGTFGTSYNGTIGLVGSNGTTYTYQYAVPSQPSITAPTNGTNNASLTPTITSSAFSGDLTHTSSDWQVDDNADFSSVTFSSATDTTNLTSITVSPALSPNTTYYARMRHNSAAGNSTWATSVSFTTVANAPSAPTLSASSATTLGVTINVNSNPASTEFAIQETGSSNYVQANGTLSASAVWQNNATWGTVSVTGLSVGTQYTFQVKARNSANVETAFSSTASLYTLVNVPGTPTVNNATTTTMDVLISINSNPASTEFAIQETGSSNYVQANGTLSASAVWQTNANWGTKTVSGLSVGTQYTFKVKARNGNNTETAFSSTASLYTLANAPGTPTVNTPTTSSLKVILSENSNPSAVTYAIQETGSSNYVQADGTLGASAVWQTYANWGGANGVIASGLSVNTQYTFKAKARNGDSTETAFSETTSLYTAANIPAAPTLGSPTASGLTVTVNVNSNPASTEFAIQETSSSNYVQTDGTLGASATWQNITNWGGVSGKIVSGLSVNTSYTFKTKARNGNSVETDFSATASLYTAANVPGTPTVNTPTTSSLKVILSENSNPSTVTYAIQETSSGNYIQTNGTLSTSAVWQTYTNWGGVSGVTVSGLSPNVQYTFKVKARNGDSVETSFSGTSSLYTASGVPGTPILSNISTTSLTVTIDSASNPAGTEFAIQETSSSNYVQADGTLSVSAAWQTYTNWGGASGKNITGLSINALYTFRVKSRSGDAVESNVGDSTSGRTLANIPGTPTVNTPSTNSLKVIIDVNSNPASTEFAIQETGSSNYVQADGTFAVGEIWQTHTNWGSTNGVNVTGLSSNVVYSFKVKSRNASNAETSFSSSTSLYTLSRVPGTPVLSSPTSSSLTLVIEVNSNGASTEFAIQEIGSSNYVQADGTLGANATWQNITNWGGVSGKIVSGLSVNTSYIFKTKARNGNSVETDFSGTTSLYTAANIPGTPTFGNFSSNSLDLTLSLNGNPESTAFSIQENSTAQYLQSNGLFSTGEVFQTYLQWGGSAGKTLLNLLADTLYTILIKARNADGVATSASSFTSPTRTSAIVPGSPTLTGEVKSDQITITFSANNNPSTVVYAIYSATTSNYVQTNGRLGSQAVWQNYTLWNAASGVTITGLESNTNYAFQVKAKNSDGTETSLSSSLSVKTAAGGSAFKVDSVPPLVPSNFIAEQQGEQSVLLTWKDPAEIDLNSILVLRSIGTAPLSANPYAVVSKGTQQYIDQAVFSDVTFQYQLQARDRVGNLSELTPIVSVTVSAQDVSSSLSEIPPSPSEGTSLGTVGTDVSQTTSVSSETSAKTEEVQEIFSEEALEVLPEEVLPDAVYELISSVDALPKNTLVKATSLDDLGSSSLQISPSDTLWGDVHELNLVDENTDAVIAEKLQRPFIVKIVLRKGFLKEHPVDFRRIVFSRWIEEEKQWKDFPVRVSENEDVLYAQTKEMGFYAVRITEHVNKWSKNAQAQLNIPSMSTAEGVFTEIFQLPRKFTARPNNNTRGPFGWAYNLITLTDGFHKNIGTLLKKIDLSLHYDLDFMEKYHVSCERIILMRYEASTKKWESVPAENFCRLGVLRAAIGKLGVYAAMIVN